MVVAAGVGVALPIIITGYAGSAGVGEGGGKGDEQRCGDGHAPHGHIQGKNDGK